ncbi:ShlB/FhaC/HecB family hemolysin secretion/activation protein [Providencia sp. PROV032]|uniref:ShlB/FhaC/HecB family hemolysin secretion/activation protein n=1 Tax=Providencia sp. PROV032 TaxID=2949764 RepID=UPI0023493353|nr:ShlB/FhaC/HecB family hemolysin secretion/activation protein [Providencia sp. PROV032]
MKNKYILVVLFLLIFLCGYSIYSLANTDAGNMSDSTRELDKLIRERNIDNINKEKWINREINNNNKKIIEKDYELEKELDNVKYLITSIVIENDDVFANSKKRNNILKNYTGKELGKTEILKLIGDLTDFYIDKGYTTTLLTLQEGNLNSKELRLMVLWGKINDVLIDGKNPTFFQKMRVNSAFPFYKGKVLDISDVDQTLDNLLRISYKAKIRVLADDEIGFSNLDIENLEYDYINGSLKLNNSGRKESGWNQYSGNFSVNNFIGFNDILGFYYGYNELKQKADTQNSWSVSYSIPFGYSSFDASYYRSEYEKLIGGNFGGYKSDGNSERYSFKFNHVVFRNSEHKLSLYTALDVKDNLNRIQNLIIDVSSKRYSNISIGMNDVTTIWDGGTYWDLSFTKGTPWFGSAWVNDPDLKGFDINFVKMNGLVSWSKNIYQFDRFSISYDLNTSFQYSNNILVSDQNITIGDEYSVRGFKEESISGNNGGYISNTLKFPFYFNGFGGVMATPFFGYDVGYIKNNCSIYVNKCSGEYISGGALGLRLNQKYFSSSLSAGWPLIKPKSLRNRDVDNLAIYYRIGVNF